MVFTEGELTMAIPRKAISRPVDHVLQPGFKFDCLHFLVQESNATSSKFINIASTAAANFFEGILKADADYNHRGEEKAEEEKQAGLIGEEAKVEVTDVALQEADVKEGFQSAVINLTITDDYFDRGSFYPTPLFP